MVVCFGFGCKQRMMLGFTSADRKRATGRASPDAERKALSYRNVLAASLCRYEIWIAGTRFGFSFG
jgi:hypothetical protein